MISKEAAAAIELGTAALREQVPQERCAEIAADLRGAAEDGRGRGYDTEWIDLAAKMVEEGSRDYMGCFFRLLQEMHPVHPIDGRHRTGKAG